MPDVIFYEVFEEEEAFLKKFLPAQMTAVFTPDTVQESKHDVPGAALISIRTQSIIPSAWGRMLKGVLTRSRGQDHLIRFLSETSGNVVGGHLPPYCSRAVAEHAVLCAQVLLRKLPRQLTAFDTFDRHGLMGKETRGRKALVVGVGNIGAEIVDVARGLRMDVRGVDIDPRRDGLEYVTLDEGLAWGDIVFCAVPLTDQTRGLLNYSAMKTVSPGAIFVNIARGEIAPEEDLRRLLDENKLGGIALDVFSEEAEVADDLRSGPAAGGSSARAEALLTLRERENVLMTPHNAFNTMEAVTAKARDSVDAVACFLKKGTFPHMIRSRPK